MSDEIMRMAEGLWRWTGGGCCFVALQLRLLVYVPTLTLLLGLNTHITPNASRAAIAVSVLKFIPKLRSVLCTVHHVEVRVILCAKSW